MIETPRNAAVVTHCAGNIDKQLTLNKKFVSGFPKYLCFIICPLATWGKRANNSCLSNSLLQNEPLQDLLPCSNHLSFGTGSNLVVLLLGGYGLTNMVAVNWRFHQGQRVHSGLSLVWDLTLDLGLSLYMISGHSVV